MSGISFSYVRYSNAFVKSVIFTNIHAIFNLSNNKEALLSRYSAGLEGFQGSDMLTYYSAETVSGEVENLRPTIGASFSRSLSRLSNCSGNND